MVFFRTLLSYLNSFWHCGRRQNNHVHQHHFEGFRALERMREDNGLLLALFITTFFPASISIMARVERSTLPQTGDPMKFRSSMQSDYSMLSITAAILAQLDITAMAFQKLDQMHWTANAALVTSLVCSCLSAWTATTCFRLLASLDRPDTLRDWLSIPASRKARLDFEKTLKMKLIGIEADSEDTIKLIRVSISQFLLDNRWKYASFYSCTMLSAPSIFLHCSLLGFLAALGIYLGSVWSKNLSPVAGDAASRAVLICYTVCLLVGTSLFFVSNNRKNADRDFIGKWMRSLEQAPARSRPQTDVEVGISSDLGSGKDDD